MSQELLGKLNSELTSLSMNLHDALEQKITRYAKLTDLTHGRSATPANVKGSPEKMAHTHRVDMNLVKGYIDALTEEAEEMRQRFKDSDTKLYHLQTRQAEL